MSDWKVCLYLTAVGSVFSHASGTFKKVTELSVNIAPAWSLPLALVFVAGV
jgi:hypothetical protein